MKQDNWKEQLVSFEIIVPIIMVIFILVFIVDVYDLPRISRRTPLLVGTITLVLLFFQIGISVLKIRKNDEKKEAGKKLSSLKTNKAFYLLLIMLLYHAGIYYVGFFPSTIVMLAITMRMIGEKSLIKISLVSGIFLLTFYFVFMIFFGLRPPSGVLW